MEPWNPFCFLRLVFFIFCLCLVLYLSFFVFFGSLFFLYNPGRISPYRKHSYWAQAVWKIKDEILRDITKKFGGLCIIAVQQFPDTIRITFISEETAVNVLKSSGVRLAWVVAHPPPLLREFSKDDDEDADAEDDV